MRHEELARFVREQLVFIAVSVAAFASGPAIVHAQNREFAPVVFSESLDLSRGRLLPGTTDGLILSRGDYCYLMLEEWGWESCDGIDAVIVGHLDATDTTMIAEPNSAGFVRFDDWESADRDSEIARIEAGLERSLAVQSERTGDDIRFLGWRSYPTLNPARHYMYYATDISWNGSLQTNIRATVFDRKGYVVFTIVPIAADPTAGEIEAMIDATLNRYVPAAEQSYAAFVTGDKVATAGAIGVLATMMGVKYGKSATAGFMAALLLIAKKAWFVLLLPLVWLKRLFR